MLLAAAKKQYLKARKEYYGDGLCSMTDAQFDKLETRIAKEDPEWKPLHATGVAVGKKTSVPLPTYMPSLNKIQYDDSRGLERFVKREVPGATWLNVMPKYDGSSILFVYTKGKLTRAMTRGDGKTGKDITHLLAGLPQVPKTLGKQTQWLRCEAAMPVKVWERKWSKQFDNARNQVAGVLNRTDLHASLKDLHFIVLRDLSTMASIHTSLAKIKKLIPAANKQFVITQSESVLPKKTNPESLKALFEKYQKTSKYLLDGLVLHSTARDLPATSDKPKFATAWKMASEDESAISTVTAIEWDVSRSGRLTPVVHIKPVRISNATVRKATAHNASWAVEKGLCVGAKVKLIRSGEVIPKILEVTGKSGKKLVMPKASEFGTGGKIVWDANKTHLYFKAKTGEASASMKAKRLQHFATKMEIDNLGPAVAVSLVELGYDTPLKLIRMKQAQWGQMPGFKEKSAERLFNAIQDAAFKEPRSLAKVMAASGKFGEGVGERRFQQVIMHKANLLSEKASQGSSALLAKKINEIPGMAEFVATDIAKNLSKFWTWARLTGIEFDMVTKKKKITIGKLTGQVVTFTGYRDKDHTAAIEAAGGTVASSFSGKTTILVYKEGGKASSKVEKAKKAGARVCTFSALKL